MKKYLLLVLSLIALNVFPQPSKYKIACLGFYNLENLYDTINDPKTIDEEFLPNGNHLYNTAAYTGKLSNLSDAISQLATDDSPDGVVLLGVAEVENDKVLQDLIVQPKLKDRHYKFIHYDSRDNRGVDVALIYNSKYFKVIFSKTLFIRLDQPDGSLRFTRDVLWVFGELDGEPVHIFVNHWPSRRGGEDASANDRAKAARVPKHIIDSLMKIDVNTKIILMGDLNDDPVSPSVAKVLGAKGDKNQVKDGDLYNPFTTLYKKGIGTLAYNDSWNLFDQEIFSSAFLNKDQKGFFFQSAHVFNKEFLITRTGRYKGYPKRTYDGLIYNDGYSDHFPVYSVLMKEIKN